MARQASRRERNGRGARIIGNMLYLALSCLQGRPMRAAFDELRALDAELGIQLTPGNVPTSDFRAHVTAAGTATRTHHGFSFAARKRAVWSEDGSCRVRADSLHPPVDDHACAAKLMEQLETLPPEIVLETMYPGYCMGDDASLLRAMSLSRPLAVDVSHVYLALVAGTLQPSTWARLQDYARVVEVHVSANDGRSDAHRPLAPDTFGLGWAQARARAGAPLVLECYLHRLSRDERRRQIDLARG